MLPRTPFVTAVHFVLLFLPANNCDSRKSTKKRPDYHVYGPDLLPADLQITKFLYKGEPKTFYYSSQSDIGGLSATVIACSSPVRWSMNFSENRTVSDSLVTAGMHTFHLPVHKGRYVLQTEALDRDTLLHIYISTEPGGPQALQNARSQQLGLLKRQKRRRLTIKWNPSLVDPQGTDYCLVMSKRHNYPSLCSAQSQHSLLSQPLSESQTVTVHHDPSIVDDQQDPIIACVGRKTHYTVSDLQKGQRYYFDLFAINGRSNFTYPFASATAIFDGKNKPTSLQDGKATFANLKQLDGKAVFRYKVGRKSGKSLDLFVVPCGGAVEVEITTKDATVATPKRVEGFGKISIPNPVTYARYYIKIFAMNREELKKTTGVEIYATTRSPSRIPLPNMPVEAKVQEYHSLRTCDSVTVGWITAPVPRVLHYCLVVKEGKMREVEDFKMPNQCGLENRLKKSADFIAKYCRDLKHHKEEVVTQTIKQLKPGRSYIVQVTVKKPKGKTLSYDLLQVHTKPKCSRQLD